MTGEPPLQRLRAGGTGRILSAVVVASMTLGILVWHPWGATGPAEPVPLPTPAAAVAPASGPSAPARQPAPSPTATPPSVGSASVGPYRSLVDNEWTVVALLMPTAVSADEPALPHATAAPWSADGPFLVVQQGLGEASGQRRSQAGVCSLAAPPLDRPAVHLPAGRVAYLGITYPGMDPRAGVRATVLGASGTTLRRVSPVVVQLDGLSPAGRYTLPSSGPGGTILFATSRPGIMPIDTYRFEIDLPGTAGPRYLYACIGT